MNYDASNHQIITVMCDYCGAFLWGKKGGLSERDVGPNIVDCFCDPPLIWPEGWKIPLELELRFFHWQVNFERYSFNNSRFNWVAHFREEDVLVDELQKVLGWKEYVVRPSCWRHRLSEQYPYD